MANLENNPKKWKWTRVNSGNSYQYVRTGEDNRIIDDDFDFSTGKFKIYNLPNESSFSSFGSLNQTKFSPRTGKYLIDDVDVVYNPKEKKRNYSYTANSAYHPEDVAKVMELPFLAFGKGLSYTLGEDNAQKVGMGLSYLMPSRYIGWARSGYMPHDYRNPGIENGRPEEKGLNLLSDLVLAPATGKMIKGTGEVAGEMLSKTKPYRSWQISNAINSDVSSGIRNLSNRTYTEHAGNYRLFSPFGEDIGNLFTTKPLTSDMKGKGISMVANKNKGKGVSEDLYNVAVEDSKVLGLVREDGSVYYYPGLESGHDLFNPKLTMHVTDKFPKIEIPNISLQKINGKWKYAPDPNLPSIRLLTGTSGKPMPAKILELTNHRINLQDLETIPTFTKPYSSTSLRFFEKPSKLTEAERLGIPKVDRNFTPKWHVASYPGYLLKGLMSGSPLEKQLSKNGTISINLLNAYFNKASQLEREVANKVLAEKFVGQKIIDYNLFKKAVLDELIGKYNRVPLTKWADYGVDRLGYGLDNIFNLIRNIPELSERFFITRSSAGFPMILSREYPFSEVSGREVRENFSYLFPKLPKLNTFTFESSRIPYGSNKHYEGNPLGHSRTYTTPDEPNILHVMESQSDWALKSLGLTKAEKTAIQNIDEQLKTGTPTGFSTLEELQVQKQAILDRASQRTLGISYLSLHLHDNYLQRLLQENLRYAAENGLTKMRYPTPETAAKIEGYLKVNHTQLNELSNLQMKLGELFENGEISWEEYNKMIDAINKLKKELFGKEYDPKHQTILKKYADFPKLFLKLYKGQNVRTVTDAKGNTWYEVDVPKGYLSREWQFRNGGKMNTLLFLKNGSGIHIKKKNKGKFTSYCGGKVTDECIRKAKASGNPTLVKRATFAANARKWKHEKGGQIKKYQLAGTITMEDRLNKWRKEIDREILTNNNYSIPSDNTQVVVNPATRSILPKIKRKLRPSRRATALFVQGLNLSPELQKEKDYQDSLRTQAILNEENFDNGVRALSSLGALTLPSTYVGFAMGNYNEPGTGNTAVDLGIDLLSPIIASKTLKAGKFIWNNGKLVLNEFPATKGNFYRVVKNDAILDANNTGIIRSKGFKGAPYFSTDKPFIYYNNRSIIEGTPETPVKWTNAYGRTTYEGIPTTLPIEMFENPKPSDLFPIKEGITGLEVIPWKGNNYLIPTTGFSYWKKHPIIGWRLHLFKK